MYPQVMQFETRERLVAERLELRALRRAAKPPRPRQRVLKLAPLLGAPTPRPR